MNKLLFLAFFYSIIISDVESQELPLSPINIGQKIPDFDFRTVNYFKPKSNNSDFHNKYVIIDFWATWCGSCIKHFPQLDSLQKKYSDRLQVVLVNSKNTGDGEFKIADFFRKLQGRIKKLQLFSIIGDSLLLGYFPHKILPHYVWINNEGIVVAITGSEELTTGNFERFINGGHLQVKEKRDDLFFDKQQPLFVGQNTFDEKVIQYRSLVTKYLDGVAQSVTKIVDSNNLITRFCMTNYSIVQLIKQAYQVFDYNNRVVLQVSDSSRYRDDGNWDSWLTKNGYCYELMTQPIELNSLYKKMQLDLAFYFQVDAKIEMRFVSCLVLKNLNPGKPADSMTNDIHQKIGSLVSKLNLYSSIPVVSEVNYLKKLDINEFKNLKSFPDVNTILKNYGLVLEESKREMKMFVITENGWKGIKLKSIKD